MTAINDITGDKIASKVLSERGRANFDLIFPRKKKVEEYKPVKDYLLEGIDDELIQAENCDCPGFCTGACTWETCPYCGIKTDSPCDAPPPAECEQAINKVHGAWLNDLN